MIPHDVEIVAETTSNARGGILDAMVLRVPTSQTA
jgi:hypothetical protein